MAVALLHPRGSACISSRISARMRPVSPEKRREEVTRNRIVELCNETHMDGEKEKDGDRAT